MQVATHGAYNIGILSLDVEVNILKIFNYFAVYTIRIVKLKEFYLFVDSYHKTFFFKLKNMIEIMWLCNLMPAIERILKFLIGTSQTFIDSVERPPKIISDFFKNLICEICFLFLHSNLNLFEKT